MDKTPRTQIGNDATGQAMLNALLLPKMNILQCQKLAQDIGYNSSTFDLCGPKGTLKCNWLDAYFGFFQIDGKDGFQMANDFAFVPDVWCENLRPVKVVESSPEPKSTPPRKPKKKRKPALADELEKP